MSPWLELTAACAGPAYTWRQPDPSQGGRGPRIVVFSNDNIAEKLLRFPSCIGWDRPLPLYLNTETGLLEVHLRTVEQLQKLGRAIEAFSMKEEEEHA